MGSRGWFDIERAVLTLGVQCMGWIRELEFQDSVCRLRFG